MDIDTNFLNILKEFYRPGVVSLLLRDDPFLNLLKTVRVSGEKYVFNALFDHGSGTSADYEVSRENAVKVAHNAKFSVPIVNHQLFSSYFVNTKQIEATVNERGSFIVDAVNDFAAATDGFRKMMAACAWGNSYGQIGTIAASTAFVSGTPQQLTLTSSQIMKVSEDMKLTVKTALNATPPFSVNLTITEVDEDASTITVVPDATYTTSATEYLTFAGSTDPSGNPLLPPGILDSLPIVNARSGVTWRNFISTSHWGVNRSARPASLAGNFYYNSGNTTYKQDIYGLAAKVRRHCSKAPVLIVNDNDYVKLMAELDTTNRNLTDTRSKSKDKDGSMGWDTMSVSVSKTYIDTILDSPFCQEGMFVIISPDTWELVSMTNTEKVKNPGEAVVDGGSKAEGQEVETMGAGAIGTNAKNDIFGLNIDDYIATNPGHNWEGPGLIVSLKFRGGVVCVAPGKNGVGIFHDATPANLIGY